MSKDSGTAIAEEGKGGPGGMTGDRRPRGTVANADPSPADVEELLRAAQDDLLLKLTVDVHTTTTSSSSLDPDLSRRFDALRSHRAPPPPKREPPSDGPSNLPCGGGGGGPTAAGASAAVEGTRGGRSEGEEDEASKILGDDLAARFTALKGSSSSYLPAGRIIARKPERIPNEVDDDDDSDESDDGVSKKEVEKLMQWATDAARLDPDPSNSDDEEDFGKREENGSEEDGDDEDDAAAAAKAQEEERKKKTEKKRQTEGKKPPGRKWFLF